MKLLSLHVHPVKSTAPLDLDSCVVQPWGLAGDRRWLVVDPAGGQVTARTHRRLLSVAASPQGDRLTLTRPDAGSLTVAGGDSPGPDRVVEVFGNGFPARDCGEPAAAWFSELLGEPVRLVHMADPTTRRIPAHKATAPGDVVSAADAFPLLLTTLASLVQVNAWIAADHPDDAADPLPMRRFRPNLVVDGELAFDEDGWTRVRVGDVVFRGAGPCARCVLTTIDPWTLDGGKEPIRTLSAHRRRDGKTWFGLNLVPEVESDTAAVVRVGDPVEVLSRD